MPARAMRENVSRMRQSFSRRSSIDHMNSLSGARGNTLKGGPPNLVGFSIRDAGAILAEESRCASRPGYEFGDMKHSSSYLPLQSALTFCRHLIGCRAKGDDAEKPRARLKMGDRERGMARLEEAVTATGGLRERTRERVPLPCGEDAEQPGTALPHWGKRRTDLRAGRCDWKSGHRIRAALQERTREGCRSNGR